MDLSSRARLAQLAQPWKHAFFAKFSEFVTKVSHTWLALSACSSRSDCKRACSITSFVCTAIASSCPRKSLPICSAVSVSQASYSCL
eukprot:Skav216275  [mRNA]  locus=scaffold951:82921:90245:- [translate_table: standard]